MIPALTQRMLMGPKWEIACSMDWEMEVSQEMSPWRWKMGGGRVWGFSFSASSFGGGGGGGRRS